jgi:hypothetical protein
MLTVLQPREHDSGGKSFTPRKPGYDYDNEVSLRHIAILS